MNREGLLCAKKGYPLYSLLGFLFVLFCKAEADLAACGNIVWNGSYLLELLAVSLVAGILLGCILCFMSYRLSARERKQECGQVFLGQGKVFWIALALIVLCWVPCYLAYYPAICAYDTNVQTGQIVDGAYNDHHPIAHTLLVAGAMEAGERLFGDVNTGIALYAALQMLFLAGALAYGISLLNRFRVRRVFRVLLLLYAMLFPFHWYMSISVIKDTVFSAFFLLQVLSFYGILREGGNSRKITGLDISFFIGTLGMILFRNNGKYAMMVLLFFLFLALWKGKQCRRLWGRMFLNAMVAFLAGNLLLTALFRVTNAEQGDRREMLSMPIQQMARCMLYHGGIGVLPEDDATMEEQDKALINDFLLDESYREYRPDISDPVKRHTNTYVPRYRTEEFVTTYLNLLAEYPGDYINAVLAVNAGYLFPGDTTHAVINENGVDKGLGYVQTRWVDAELNPRGIYKDSKWELLHEKLEDWADRNAYLDIPVLKYMFVPGSYLWLYLLLACILILQKRYRMLLPLSPVLGYYITLFLGPTVQLRYLYPLMIVLPFAVLLSPGQSGLVQKECDEKDSVKG